MSTVIRWQPLREVASLQNELSRFMNGVLDGNGRQTQAWVPALDVWETDHDLVYAFDVPGIPQDEITVEVEDGVLTVSAKRERKVEVTSDRYRRFERRHGTFSRTVGLPQGTTEADVSASYEHGVLEVHVRKPAEVKPRRIEVKLGGAEPQTIEGTTPS